MTSMSPTVALPSVTVFASNPVTTSEKVKCTRNVVLTGSVTKPIDTVGALLSTS